jgi:hypothetical protein
MFLLVAVGAKVTRASRTDVIHSTTQIADLVTLREGVERKREDKTTILQYYYFQLVTFQRPGLLYSP